MSALALVGRRLERESPGALAGALHAQLQTLREVIGGLSADAYCAAPSRQSGTIGAHVRHVLDHAAALLTHRGPADLSYDTRLRGTPVERDARAAAAEIDRLCRQLEDIEERDLEQPMRLAIRSERGAAPVRVRSSRGRELAFVLQHTIHHAAQIAVLLETLGRSVPHAFGYAPTTPVA